MKTETLACKELERIRHLSAFNVRGAVYSQRINQHVTMYAMADNSVLKIHTTKGHGTSGPNGLTIHKISALKGVEQCD